MSGAPPVCWSMTLFIRAAWPSHTLREREPARRRLSQPRATRRFAFDRSASTRAGTTSIPNPAAISWQVRGP